MTNDTNASPPNDPLLLEHAIDRFGAQCEAEWLESRGETNYTSEFLEQGYYVAPMPASAAEVIKGFFSDDNACKISGSAARDGYYKAGVNTAVAVQMNKNNIYYDQPQEEVVNALEQYFDSIKDEIERQMAHPWEVTNVRAWSVRPSADYGASTWHGDGFSRYVRKFLIFVNPPNAEVGTTELATRKGEVVQIEADTPVCLLFDAAVLVHRGRPPKENAQVTAENARQIIEVVIGPAKQTVTRCVFAGLVARVPWNYAHEVAEEIAPSRYVPEKRGGLRFPSLKRLSKAVSGAKKQLKKSTGRSKGERKLPEISNLSGRLNLGGGRRWKHRGWINLEGAPGPANPFPFWFSETVVLPVPSSSIELVYSSHCLEHLDDPTVERVFRESRRVLNADGALLLKLPDGEEVIKRWRQGDEDYFSERWGINKVTNTWQSRGVQDTIDSRATFIFCSFWNEAFGHNFTGKRNRKSKDPRAYNGPPPQVGEMAKELIAFDSPHDIASRLRQTIIDNEDDYTFNHQNCWSRSELGDLLSKCGFRVESFDVNEIVQRHPDVPDIQRMDDISLYCLAVPV